MKTILESYKRREYEVRPFFYYKRKGYGQWDIACEVRCGREMKVFREYTTDSQFIDKIASMEADGGFAKDIQKAFFNKFFEGLKEIILEWCESIH